MTGLEGFIGLPRCKLDGARHRFNNQNYSFRQINLMKPGPFEWYFLAIDKVSFVIIT